MHVLLLDDQTRPFCDLRQELEGGGARVDRADTCSGAIRLLAEHDYDWIVLPEALPDGSPLEFLKVIRPSTRHVVLLSSRPLTHPFKDAARWVGVEAVFDNAWDGSAVLENIRTSP